MTINTDWLTVMPWPVCHMRQLPITENLASRVLGADCSFFYDWHIIYVLRNNSGLLLDDERESLCHAVMGDVVTQMKL